MNCNLQYVQVIYLFDHGVLLRPPPHNGVIFAGQKEPDGHDPERLGRVGEYGNPTGLTLMNLMTGKIDHFWDTRTAQINVEKSNLKNL